MEYRRSEGSREIHAIQDALLGTLLSSPLSTKFLHEFLQLDSSSATAYGLGWKPAGQA
jgi:hypothetical protein